MLQEKRKIPRHRVYRGAHISFGGLHAAIDCVMRGCSDLGARLIVESPIGVPDRFDLVYEDHARLACRVIWRSAKEVGVAFVTEQP